MKIYAALIFFAYLTNYCCTSIGYDDLEVRKVIICPDGFINIGQHCYYFSEITTNSWDQAWLLCDRFGQNSALLNIDSIAKWTHILDYLKLNRLILRTWWIGGTDRKMEGMWIWKGHSEPFPFTAWCPGEPNNQKRIENCLVIWPINGQPCWNDIACDTPNKYFICEA